ncbi:hypothetical protein [Prosthecobacter sp.]|uniref:hypothetical protein n=1 Tax=Prosthecobacter sp. TaxID=1965333 RepID=UPI00378318CD
MKFFKPVLLLLALALVFLAGYKLASAQKSRPLQVLYMDDEALPTTPVEEQILAFIMADPREDALLAFYSKDFRRISFPRSPPDPQFPADQPVKFLPYSNCVIRSFADEQIQTIVSNYVRAYNERLAELIRNPPLGSPAPPIAAPLPSRQ